MLSKKNKSQSVNFTTSVVQVKKLCLHYQKIAGLEYWVHNFTPVNVHQV